MCLTLVQLNGFANTIILAEEEQESAKSISKKPKVIVQLNGAYYHHGFLPRLAEVLQPIGLKQNWYWPASRLYDLNDTSVESHRIALLEKLAQLITSNTGDSALTDGLLKIKNQISQWQLAKRVLIPIDFDLAKINPSKNPKFSAGRYLLNLSKRTESIDLFGLLNAPVEMNHKGGSSINYYAEKINFLPSANKSELYIIQPDGKIIKAGYAYFNNTPIELMPGSSIFVPFISNLFSTEFDELNQQIAELAINRISQ